MFTKKIVSWFLVIVMTAAIAVGGTMAYLTDNDEDVNVLTVGNVKVDQLEYERVDIQTKDDDAIVQEFHNDKPLYPVVTDPSFDWSTDDAYTDWNQIGKNDNSGIWDPDLINNEQDKMVFVKNKGDFAAYVRTVFAFECGDFSWEEFRKLIHINLNDEDYSWEWIQTPVEIDGSNYFLVTATYKDALEPGQLTEPSLLQVALDAMADNDDIISLGEEYSVLVASQAMQTEGFTAPEAALIEGFYQVTTQKHPFMEEFKGFAIYDEYDLSEFALVGGEGRVMEDFTVRTPVSFKNKEFILDLNGHTLYNECPNNYGYIIRVDAQGKMTITGDGQIREKRTLDTYHGYPQTFIVSDQGSLLIIENGYFEGGPVNGGHTIVWAQKNGKAIINGGTFDNAGSTAAGDFIYVRSGGHIDINGGFFRNDGKYIWTLNSYNGSGGTMTVRGGTFVNFRPDQSDDPGAIIVPDGYQVVGETQANGEVFYSVVPIG